MSATKKLLAIDLGAESGRGLVGSFDGRRLALDEVQRFPNGGVATLDTLHWDILRLHQEIVGVLRKSALEHGDLASVGICTWGVDFGLLGRDGVLLGNPRHYRDPHTEGALEEAYALVPKLEIYRRTGIQFMRINSLFQLAALKRARSPILEAAETFLMIADLLHYWLTGIKVVEYTNASTTQMLDPAARTWASDLVRRLGLPDRILGTVIQPGTVLGPLRPSVVRQTGLSPIPVVAPATHDTGSAVAAVPAQGDSWAFLSSGTWSLMGAEVREPITTDKALAYNFTNEGGVAGTIRLLKNIAGMWLLQECRRTWENDGIEYSYEKLMQLAGEAPAFASVIDPDDESFLLPPKMPQAIALYCRRTGQAEPATPGSIVRTALEGLALRYRWVLERLEELTGRKLAAIHVVGGGSRNTLLCQWTADACARPVIAGPVEATAIGNVLVQMIGLGLIRDLSQAREVVRESFEVRTFEPQEPTRWDEPYRRFVGLLG
jgi:rhamnulokinase